jgi:purine-binding chemotaxis protein CheW
VSGRRKSTGAKPAMPTMPEMPEKIPALPASGLASEILALLAGGGVGGTAADEPAPVAAAPDWAAEGADRLFSLADRLTRRGAAVASAAPEKPETWVTFEVAGEVYGLPVLSVEEVLRVTVITRLPYAPAPMRGITQLRGRVLPVVDLAVRLGAPPVETGPRSRIVVVTARGRTLGLLVDAARQVVKLLPSAMEAPPPEIVSDQSDFIVAVVRHPESLIILLDVERALLLPAGEDRNAAI